MNYPSPEDVEAADHMTICRWWRFLPSPGETAIDTPQFEEVLDREVLVMNRIGDRLVEFGGFTPAISKALGWTSR